MTITLVADAISSWWIAPKWSEVDGFLFGSCITSAGEVLAIKVDLSDFSVETATLIDHSGSDIDDHNAAAHIVTDDKPPIYLYARHNLDDRLRYRIGDDDPGVLSFASEAYNSSFTDDVTYVQAWRRPGTDEVHAFTREDYLQWSSIYSTDWGANWSARRVVFRVGNGGDYSYILTVPTAADKDLLRVAVAQHPTDALSTTHDIGVCTIRLSTGDIKNLAGTTLGNLKTGVDLPVEFSDIDLAVDTASGHTTRLYDVSDGDVWEIAYGDWEIADGTDSTYRLATLDGTWSSSDIVASGPPFFDGSLYFGGLAIPRGSDGGVVYSSRNDSGTWRIERWSYDGSWAATELESSATHMLIRPYATGSSDLPVVWHRAASYTDTLTWESSLEGGGGGFMPPPFGIEVGFNAPTFTVEADRGVYPAVFGIEVGFQPDIVFRSGASRQVMLTGGGVETPEMTTGGSTAQVLSFNEGGAPTWETLGGIGITSDPAWNAAGDLVVADGDDSASILPAGDEGDVLTIASGVPAWAPPTSGGGGIGPILIADDHSNPLIFADLLQTEEGDDLLYFDGG